VAILKIKNNVSLYLILINSVRLNEEGESLKVIIDAGFRVMNGVSDLNDERRFWRYSGFSYGGCHEHWKTLFTQLTDILLRKTCHRIVDHRGGDR